MRKPPIKDQLLTELEHSFRTLLMSCLAECESGRWGLFGQNDGPEAARYLGWENAEQLRKTALRIHDLRAEFGQPNPLVERFLQYSSLHGSNLPGEPKLAEAFLDEIEKDAFDTKQP